MKKSYSDKLKSPKWQRKRLEIMRRDNFTCKLCKDSETELHVHHLEYIDGNDPWEYDNKKLVTLCVDCHSIVEKMKKEESDPIDFKRIKILKLNNWQGGSKVIFISYGDTCSMKIFDENDKWVCGYNFNNDIPNIIKVLKYAQNG